MNNRLIDPNPFVRLDKRFDPLKWICCFLMFIMSYAIFYQLCLRPSSDISIHATWAAEGDFSDITSFLHHGAHPMWHVLVSIVLLFGVPLPVAASLVTALSKAIELWIVHRLFTIYLRKSIGPSFITLLAVVCTMVSCLCIPAYNPTVYLGVGTPNTWHSCTQLIALVWMLFCVPYTAHCYDEFERLEPSAKDRTLLPWHKPILLGAMLFATLLAKPTFMQAFLPAACLFFLVKWIQHPKNSRYFLQIILCILPAVLFMIIQYLYYFGYIVPSQGDMVLEISMSKLLDVLIRVALMEAFPIYVMLSTHKKGRNDTFFILTIVFNLVSIVEYALLGESGRRAADGNFGWGMMGAAMMFWVIAMIRYAQEMHSGIKVQKRIRPKHVAATLLLCWHLASGVYYLVYLFTTNVGL